MSELLKPPAFPSAILSFFASQPDFPAVAGDISEEFHQRSQSSGPRAAKRWYWREALRNAFALTWRELSRTPILTTIVAFVCFLAVNLISIPLELRFDRSTNVLILLNLASSFALGWIGAKLRPGQEWALALIYTVVTACITLLILWHIFFVFPLRDHLPGHFRGALIGGQVLRQVFFWLGCFLIRVHSRSKGDSQICLSF
jgi:hypothetical protein